jgi:hypothetical protein
LPVRELTHYCVVLEGLPLGVTGAQLVHAAGESSPGGIPEGTHAVVLAAKSEMQLLSLEKKLLAKNIPHAAIREPDAPFFGQLMAIGLAPSQRTSAIKNILGNLPLLGKEV